MASKERNYLAARLIEEREAAREASTPEAREAHEELAARYEEALNELKPASAKSAPKIATAL